MDEAIEGEEAQSLESGSSSARTLTSSNRLRNQYENKPYVLGKTADNIVPFDENIGLLTANEVKRLEKYGKVIEQEEATRELE